MHGLALKTLVPALLLAILPAALSAQHDPAEREVRAVVDSFTAALERGDSVRALAYLHPDLLVYEGGHAETLAEYRSHHLASDIAFLAATRSETLATHLQVMGESALWMSESRTRGTVRERQIDSRGAETFVLVRTPEGWKIRHIHWSSGRSQPGG
jgi:ketosteroid isomerase-like protein